MFRSPIIYIKHSPELFILVHYLYVYCNVETIFKLIYYRTKQMFQEQVVFSFAASDSMLRSYGPGYTQSWRFGEAINQKL